MGILRQAELAWHGSLLADAGWRECLLCPLPVLCAGAAMFVQCVVASEVIRIAQGAPCRGATLRDVATFTLSLLGVALSFSSGTVSAGMLSAL